MAERSRSEHLNPWLDFHSRNAGAFPHGPRGQDMLQFQTHDWLAATLSLASIPAPDSVRSNGGTAITKSGHHRKHNHEGFTDCRLAGRVQD